MTKHIQTDGLETLPPEIREAVIKAVNTVDPAAYLDDNFVVVDIEGVKSLSNWLARGGRLLDRVLQSTGARPRQHKPDYDGYDGWRERFNDRTADLARQYANGDISRSEWGRQMAYEIRTYHNGQYMLGKGTTRLDDRDLAEINRLVEQQMDYFNRWEASLTGDESEAAIANRAKLYGENGSATFNQAHTLSIGLPSLPSQPGDGSTTCLSNCKCRWVIQRLRGDGNFDLYWRLGVAEHCPECKVRARAWNPLRVRNGQVESFSRAGLFK